VESHVLDTDGRHAPIKTRLPPIVTAELRAHIEEAGLFLATVHDDIFRLHANKRARDFGAAPPAPPG
jgi:hypothetical protein